ncbi:MAG: FeoA family protein [Dehalococcoidia bacterium]
MTDKKSISICELRQGQSAKIVEILGGQAIASRLHAMGVRPGKKITKVSAAFLRGPVTISVDRCQIAIGWGMAQKVMVEVI